MKTLVAVLVISAALGACGGKKPASTTPSNKDQPMEMKGGATGSAADADKKTDAPANKDAPNPCAAP